MTILRPVFLSLLCLAVLPWAAFARHMPTPGAGTVVAASTVHRAERPCRGASLPGSSCAPEAVLASAAVATTARVAMSIPLRNARLHDLRWPQRPLDPPKSNG